MRDGTIVETSPLPPPGFTLDREGAFRDEYRYMEDLDVRSIVYMSDGLRIRGFRVRPAGPGPFPCVVCCRGGNRDFASIGDLAVANLLCRIASWGYLVVASQYRGGGGSEGGDEFGGADIADVMNLFPLLDADPDADASRIGMYGGSRGGMMTYLALARTDRVRAAVIRCGVSDLTGWRNDRADMETVYRDLIPGFAGDPDGTLERRSALRWAERICPATPILILHGTADWRVGPLSALRMGEELLRLRRPSRLVTLEGADHALSECIPERDRQTRDWFDRFVLRGERLPDMTPHGE